MKSFSRVLGAIWMGMAAMVICGTNAQITPVPNRALGWEYQNKSAEVVITAYYDWMCPDSRASWPGVKGAVDSYSPAKVGFVLNAFPLPYHYASYLCAQGAQGMPNTADVFKWLDAVFSVQEQFGNSNLTSFDNLRSDLNHVSVSKVGVDISKTLTDPTSDWHARLYWKHGCSRGVSGTPTYFVNDVMIDADSTWTVQQWTQFLDPIISDNDDI